MTPHPIQAQVAETLRRYLEADEQLSEYNWDRHDAGEHLQRVAAVASALEGAALPAHGDPLVMTELRLRSMRAEYDAMDKVVIANWQSDTIEDTPREESSVFYSIGDLQRALPTGDSPTAKFVAAEIAPRLQYCRDQLSAREDQRRSVAFGFDPEHERDDVIWPKMKPFVDALEGRDPVALDGAAAKIRHELNYRIWIAEDPDSVPSNVLRQAIDELEAAIEDPLVIMGREHGALYEARKAADDQSVAHRTVSHFGNEMERLGKEMESLRQRAEDEQALTVGGALFHVICAAEMVGDMRAFPDQLPPEEIKAFGERLRVLLWRIAHTLEAHGNARLKDFGGDWCMARRMDPTAAEAMPLIETQALEAAE